MQWSDKVQLPIAGTNRVDAQAEEGSQKYGQLNNTPSSHPPAMTLDTQMTLALLQELLLAVRANNAESFKGWLALGLEELGRQVVLELMQDWMSPLLTEKEQDRLVGWPRGEAFRCFIGDKKIN